MRKLLLILLLFFTGFAYGQTSVTIPGQTVNVPVTINGTTVTLIIAIPSQTITIPTVVATLPAGITYTAAGGLVVTGPISSNGSITGSTLSLTGGAALPTCASQDYVWQNSSGTLNPVCLPNITVTQAASPALNTLTLTP